MNLVTIVFRRCRLIALGTVFLVAPMASVSQAEIVAADTFTRADTGFGEIGDLGITEVGDFAWSELFIQNLLGDPDVGEIINGELKLHATHSIAFIDVGLSDLTASADMHFSGIAEFDEYANHMAGFMMRISDTEENKEYFNRAENEGTVMAFVLSSGGMMIGENRNGGFNWDYIDNPFNEGVVAFNEFGFPGELPTTINGAPYDANGNGRLDDDEPFHFAAVLSGTNLDLQINGETIISTSDLDIGPLARTSGVSANGFALLRHNTFFGLEQHFPHFDNLVIDSISAAFAADFDEDGDVDGNDFLLWQTGFPTASDASKIDGDADGDGDVDGDDFWSGKPSFRRLGPAPDRSCRSRPRSCCSAWRSSRSV